MSRVVVLGGGGVTGIAWELGVLRGLCDGDVSLTADAVFGTSAGAFAGVALAGGQLDAQFAAQHEPAPDESPVRLPRTVLFQWIWAYIKGWGNAERIGAGFGAIARRRTPLTSPEQRRRAVESRLTTREWPQRLHVTAIDAQNGKLRAFNASDGYPLVDVVSASGAVPGISPMVTLGDRGWFDGGMVSSANALLAEGYDDILIIAPLPKGHGGVPDVAADVERLQGRGRGTVHLITPDAASATAIGPNIYDPARRAQTADAGREQGRAAAAHLTHWR
jgi:NTE family protein